ncbi:MAG: hypothetical protein ABIP97_09810 [Chthoniobacterales bacterium]
MKKKKNNAEHCINALAEAASLFLTATDETADSKIKQARKHLVSALDSSKGVYADLHKKATDALKR